MDLPTYGVYLLKPPVRGKTACIDGLFVVCSRSVCTCIYHRSTYVYTIYCVLQYHTARQFMSECHLNPAYMYMYAFLTAPIPSLFDTVCTYTCMHASFLPTVYSSPPHTNTNHLISTSEPMIV